MKLSTQGCRVTAADLSGRQIDTTRWLLKAINMLKEELKADERSRNG
jgi:hypothetical protein